MAQLAPYLSFDRNCREAMTFYKECLGGELSFNTVGSMPEMANHMPPELKDDIMHSSLVSGNITIFASDLNREKQLEGNTVHLCLNCENDKELETCFNNLAKGGKVVEALADMPWGGRFGSLTDKFGKHWLFNYQKSPMPTGK
jgi:PhnB protein